jgi:hypothetical protein
VQSQEKSLDDVATLSQRSKKIGRPVFVDPAFKDPQHIQELIYRNSPYQQTRARNGSRRPSLETPEPWFRGTLAAMEEPLVEGVQPSLTNPNFINAAKESFQATIIIPLSVTINIQGPMEAGKKHTDTPFFRGVIDRRLASLRYPMGASGLFQQWEVPVASAIAWFYAGTGGDLDYWPDGPDEPFSTITSTRSNIAMVSDNEHMFHRVQPIGHPSEYLPSAAADYDMTLWKTPQGWEIRNTRVGDITYSTRQIRASVLWKAYAFADAAAERAFDNHDDDLTSEMIVDIFSRDLAQRGVSVVTPNDPLNDAEWLALLARQYPVAYLNS